jgi:hypothetical protein
VYSQKLCVCFEAQTGKHLLGLNNPTAFDNIVQHRVFSDQGHSAPLLHSGKPAVSA